MWTKLWWGFITLTCEITESWRYDSRQLVLYKDKFHGNCHSRDPWEASIWHWIWRSSKDIRFSTPNDNKCTLKLETCPFALSTWHLLDNRWLYVKISVAVGFRVITKSECSKCDGRPCISSVLYDRGHQIYFFVFFHQNPMSDWRRNDVSTSEKRSPQLYHRNDYTRNQYSVMDFKSLESSIFHLLSFPYQSGVIKDKL